MAMYLIFKPDRGPMIDRVFYIGDPNQEQFTRIVENGGLIAPAPRGSVGEVVYPLVSIQADGDELEYIKSHYKNIPTTTARVCRWFGDTCMFILANWTSDSRTPLTEDFTSTNQLKQ